MSDGDRLSLILTGSVIGAAINTIVTYPLLVIKEFFFGLFTAFLIIAAAIIFLRFYRSSNLESSKKRRFLLQGISLVSFLYAGADIMQFWVGSSFIIVSYDPPYLWLGGIPLPAFLGSFLLAGLFTLAERLV